MKINVLKWVLTPHAVEKVLERKISMQDLEAVLRNPDGIVEQGPKYILYKRFEHRTDNSIAAVVIEKKGEDLWVVITVMLNFQKN